MLCCWVYMGAAGRRLLKSEASELLKDSLFVAMFECSMGLTYQPNRHTGQAKAYHTRGETSCPEHQTLRHLRTGKRSHPLSTKTNTSNPYQKQTNQQLRAATISTAQPFRFANETREAQPCKPESTKFLRPGHQGHAHRAAVRGLDHVGSIHPHRCCNRSQGAWGAGRRVFGPAGGLPQCNGLKDLRAMIIHGRPECPSTQHLRFLVSILHHYFCRRYGVSNKKPHVLNAWTLRAM